MDLNRPKRIDQLCAPGVVAQQDLHSTKRRQELRQRITYTAILLIVVRFGSHVTLPGVDAKVLAEVVRSQASNTLFGLYDLFVGGAFSNAAIFALGIMPYISASIIIQLLGAVIPYFQKLTKEGEEGRKKITQLTRYGTVVISLLQAWGISVQLMHMSPAGMPIIPAEIHGFGFQLSTMIILTTGTMFMMWLGEQITERGIGNGISLIIMAGIVAELPAAIAGMLWGGFRWLRKQIRDEFNGLTKSAGFRALISEIIADANAGHLDLQNRMHEEHRRSISELRKRDDERAHAITRLHERVDKIIQGD